MPRPSSRAPHAGLGRQPAYSRSRHTPPIPAPPARPYTRPIPPHTKGSGFVLGDRERMGARRTAWRLQPVQGNVCRPRDRRGSTSVPMRGRMAVSTVRRGGPPPSRAMGRRAPHHQRVSRPRRLVPAAPAASPPHHLGASSPTRPMRSRAPRYIRKPTTFWHCSPSPSMPRRISSPACSHLGGFIPSATPGGVPVVTTSPGSSTMNCVT